MKLKKKSSILSSNFDRFVSFIEGPWEQAVTKNNNDTRVSLNIDKFPLKECNTISLFGP